MQDVLTCPLCHQQVETLDYALHERVDRVVLDWIRREHPEWVEDGGVCPRCLELYREMKAGGGDLSEIVSNREDG